MKLQYNPTLAPSRPDFLNSLSQELTFAKPAIPFVLDPITWSGVDQRASRTALQADQLCANSLRESASKS